jgi:uncharacterized protein (TIGR02117 family)
MPAKQETAVGKRPSILRRMFRWLIRTIYAVVALFALYASVVLLGLIPVNNDFEPAPNGVEIFIVSTSVHADIILPIQNETLDWRTKFPDESFEKPSNLATHVAIGWGDKGFYIGTPTWNDLKVSTTFNALVLPSDSCMHVSLQKEAYLPEDAKSVKLSVAQYQALVKFIDNSFLKQADRSNALISGANYHSADAFFEAHGNYHCFNTCNCWVGAAMQEAGIRTPWFTPLPKSMFLYLN